MKAAATTVSFPEAASVPFAVGPIKLAIVERNEVIRQSLRALVDRAAPELTCVASYASVREAALGLPGIQPDVVLFDDRMLPLNGSGLIARLKADSPSTHILILTTFDPGGTTFESVCEGASGDLPKTTPTEELIQAIKWVHAGGCLMSMPLARRITAHVEAHEDRSGVLLTSLERQLVFSRARGTPYPIIAGELGADGVLEVLSMLRVVYTKVGNAARVT